MHIIIHNPLEIRTDPLSGARNVEIVLEHSEDDIVRPSVYIPYGACIMVQDNGSILIES